MSTAITHHPTDQLLMGYSAGILPEAFSLAIATHVSMCDPCRAQLGAFDTLGGALIENAAAPGAPAPDLAATLRRIREGGSAEAEGSTQRPRRSGAAGLPQPLAEYVGGGLDAVRWRPVGMGVRQAILPTARGARARLLHIPAGTAMPDHGHRGTEITLVLQGAFHDGEVRFGPGDVEVADEADHHVPIADIGADCICLAATDAPLRLSGLLPRLVQPFLRI